MRFAERTNDLARASTGQLVFPQSIFPPLQ
jgi:hypothetical protein